jgi:hypothetical protein
MGGEEAGHENGGSCLCPLSLKSLGNKTPRRPLTLMVATSKAAAKQL